MYGLVIIPISKELSNFVNSGVGEGSFVTASSGAIELDIHLSKIDIFT